MHIRPSDHLVTIASGGCNALSYLLANPQKVTAVDLNHAHVALMHLKIVAAKSLTQPEFFEFFGTAASPRNVQRYYTVLAPQLDFSTRQYWEHGLPGRQRIRQFKKGFYHYGLLGRLIGLVHRLASWHGVQLADLLKQPSVAAQAEWFDANVAPLFDSRLVRWLSRSPVALYNLGIPPSQYRELCESQPLAMADVLKQRARRLATIAPVDDNYFAWQAYGRRYAVDNPDNLPPYLQARHFACLQQRLARLSIEHNNIAQVLRALPAQSVDAVVLLDAQDWMNADEVVALWTQITRTANDGARVIFRTAGVASPLAAILPAPLQHRWQRDEVASAAGTAQDRSAIYGAFHVYRLAP